MIIVGLVVIGVFVVLAVVFLNKGPMDKSSARSRAYWARYEGK